MIALPLSRMTVLTSFMSTLISRQRDDLSDAFCRSTEDLIGIGKGTSDGLIAKQFLSLSLRMMSSVSTASRMAARPSEAC